MQKKTSRDLLVEYVYHDLAPDQKDDFLSEMRKSRELEDEFFQLAHMKKNLDDAELSPSGSTIDRILSFSRAYHTENTLL